jgi:hypothetical protein
LTCVQKLPQSIAASDELSANEDLRHLKTKYIG